LLPKDIIAYTTANRGIPHDQSGDYGGKVMHVS
jgi:hypothetical protein